MTRPHRSSQATVLAAVLAVGTASAAETQAPPPDIGPLPPVEANPDNPPTEARLALGRALFFDNRISASGTMNCATCHLPHQGWTVREQPLSPANPGRVRAP